MPPRQTYIAPTVAPGESDMSGDMALGTLGGIAAQIGKSAIDAKMVQQYSQAKLDLQKLNLEFKQNFADDPNDEDGWKDYKAKRNDIFSGLRDTISPVVRGTWDQNIQALAQGDDGAMELWGIQQNRTNSVKFINKSISNSLAQATLDGQNLGLGETADITAILNSADSAAKLAGYGKAHLGDATTKELLKGYNSDYLKSSLSGLAETNPLLALQALDDPRVVNAFGDNKAEYVKMKEAIEKNALNTQTVRANQEVLGTLKDEHSLLTQSLEKPISYAQLQQEFTTKKMGAGAQAFFMRANGYTDKDGKDGAVKLSMAEQLQFKAETYDQISQLVSSESVSSEDIAKLQDRIFQGLNNRAFTEGEGVNALNQLLGPMIAKKEDQFKTYNVSAGLFGLGNDIGFQGIQTMFEDEIAIQPAEGEDEVGAQSQFVNNRNKAELYDNYMAALAQAGRSLSDANHPQGIAIGEMPNLPRIQRQALYAKAQADAKAQYMVKRHPELSTLPDMPNQVLSNGTLTQGMAGPRNVTPAKSAASPFQMQVGSDGNLYRLYKDGTREKVGKAPEGLGF